MSEDDLKYLTDLCTWRDIEELFEELELYGVPPVTEIKQADSQMCLNEAMTLLKSLVNASYHMLYRHRKILREYEGLEVKRMRDTDDNLALKATVERLKRDIIEKDRALFKKEEEFKKGKELFSKVHKEFKVQTEQTRQLKCQLKYQEKKNIHDIRRKEQEICKLQGQLDQMSGSQLQKKCRQAVPAKEVKTSKILRDKEETYQDIICKFESNNRDLMLENEIINRALHKLNSDLALLVTDFDSLLHFLPNGKEIDGMGTANTRMKEEEQLLKSSEDLSLEECIASSNNHVESLNTLIDRLKLKYK